MSLKLKSWASDSSSGRRNSKSSETEQRRRYFIPFMGRKGRQSYDEDDKDGEKMANFLFFAFFSPADLPVCEIYSQGTKGTRWGG